ncbi:hypothetical protein SNEBB_006527 [Seison nebaliae]|nr:hypothetical protein SNEBB_006527 [Seison nebaliae]
MNRTLEIVELRHQMQILQDEMVNIMKQMNVIQRKLDDLTDEELTTESMKSWSITDYKGENNMETEPKESFIIHS